MTYDKNQDKENQKKFDTQKQQQKTTTTPPGTGFQKQGQNQQFTDKNKAGKPKQN